LSEGLVIYIFFYDRLFELLKIQKKIFKNRFYFLQGIFSNIYFPLTFSPPKTFFANFHILFAWQVAGRQVVVYGMRGKVGGICILEGAAGSTLETHQPATSPRFPPQVYSSPPPPHPPSKNLEIDPFRMTFICISMCIYMYILIFVFSAVSGKP
jgi:hypothetical protein